ncbi:MAG TPA: hypothetical protein VE959_22015 [Bryobacteraceae bacterium]|nr:hypothetical protein [Bryobacteraceae bacterium]
MNPNQGSGDFEADLKSAFAGMRREMGDCPDSDTLVRFTSGEMNAAEANQIALHIRLCGMCDLLVDRLRVFDRAVEAKRAGDTAPSWRVLGFLARPAFAYSLVAVLAVGLFYVRRNPPRPQEPLHSQPAPLAFAEAALNFDLNASRAKDNPIVVEIPPSRKSFTLSFAVPVRLGFRYSAEFLGPPQAPLLPRLELALDALGNAILLCRREGFMSGPYTLRVIERDSRGTATDRPFLFAFEVIE